VPAHVELQADERRGQIMRRARAAMHATTAKRCRREVAHGRRLLQLTLQAFKTHALDTNDLRMQARLRTLERYRTSLVGVNLLPG
jgi:hypothetical protein